MLDSINHMTLLCNLISGVKRHRVCNVVMDVITFPENL